MNLQCLGIVKEILIFPFLHLLKHCHLILIKPNIVNEFFLNNGHFQALFLNFRLFNAVENKYLILPMTGFKPRTSGVKSDRSTN